MIKIKKWCVKEHLLEIILLSFAAPLTIFVLGPLIIYWGNASEFEFAITDFIFWNFIYMFIAAFIIAGILLILKNISYYIIYSILFSITFCIFLQGNYLNIGINSLGGDRNEITISIIIINSIIWVLFLGIIISSILCFKRKYGSIIKNIIVVILVTIIGVQSVTAVVAGFNSVGFITHSDVENNNNTKGRMYLTYDNIDRLSDNRNIIYFVIDRFDWRYCDSALFKHPEFFDELEGFTLYDDGMSLYPRTFPSIAYMLSGYENDWSMSRYEYFDYAYKNSPYLKLLKDSDYDINIYTDIRYAYDNARSMSEYTSNVMPVSKYSINNSAFLAGDMTLISLYRYLPMGLKNLINIGTSSLSGYIEYKNIDKYTVDMRDLYNRINKNPFELFSNKKNFSFIHFTGTHTPFEYDDNFNPVDNNHDVMSALNQSFKIINSYIKEMKRLGVYNNSTIVITGDHCALSSDRKEPYREQTIPIFFKNSNRNIGKILRSSAPVAQENIFPSILESEGLYLDGDKKPMSEFKENDIVKRKYYFQRYEENNGHYEQIEYEVEGRARNFMNWKIIKRWELGKNIYD